MGVVGLFFAAMILACCISPARSPAEERRRMLATAIRTFGTATAATTITTKTTIMSSIRLNPPVRSRCVQLFLSSVLIVVDGSFGRHSRGLSPQRPNFTDDRNGTLHAAAGLDVSSSTTIIYEDRGCEFPSGKSPVG